MSVISNKYCRTVFMDPKLYAGSKWLYLFLMSQPNHSYSGSAEIRSLYPESRYKVQKCVKQLFALGLVKATAQVIKAHTARPFGTKTFIALQPKTYFDRQKRATIPRNSSVKQKDFSNQSYYTRKENYQQ